MARYMSTFIIPVPKKSIKTYLRIARASAKLWIKHGALEYVEALADDTPKGKITSFPRSVKLKSSETVVFGYAVFKSPAHAEQVLAKMHQDEKMMKLWNELPCDGMRMVWGGFKTVIQK